MNDDEIIDLIFKEAKSELSKEKSDFWHKLDNKRRSSGLTWKTGDPFDYMAIGMYVGIKKYLEIKGEK